MGTDVGTPFNFHGKNSIELDLYVRKKRFVKFMRPACAFCKSRDFASKIRKYENGYAIGVVRGPVSALQYLAIVSKAPYPVLRVYWHSPVRGDQRQPAAELHRNPHHRRYAFYHRSAIPLNSW